MGGWRVVLFEGAWYNEHGEKFVLKEGKRQRSEAMERCWEILESMRVRSSS